jgi:DNA-binding transcriptional MocR family regulator
LRNGKESCIGYEQTQGNIELREQIAKLSFNWGGKVKPEEVIITGGCLEAITICLKAVTKPGDTVAVECPTYFGIYQAVENLGLKVVEVTTCGTDGIDLDCLEKVVNTCNIKACIVVPNFNNPLGSCMPEENKKKLVEIITEHNIPLIEDDIYGELYFGKSRPKTCKYFDKKGIGDALLLSFQITISGVQDRLGNSRKIWSPGKASKKNAEHLQSDVNTGSHCSFFENGSL